MCNHKIWTGLYLISKLIINLFKLILLDWHFCTHYMLTNTLFLNCIEYIYSYKVNVYSHTSTYVPLSTSMRLFWGIRLISVDGGLSWWRFSKNHVLRSLNGWAWMMWMNLCIRPMSSRRKWKWAKINWGFLWKRRGQNNKITSLINVMRCASVCECVCVCAAYLARSTLSTFSYLLINFRNRGNRPSLGEERQSVKQCASNLNEH